MEIEINKSDRFAQTRASNHILVLLSENYIKKEPYEHSTHKIFYNIYSILAGKKEVLFLQDLSKLPTKRVNNS